MIPAPRPPASPRSPVRRRRNPVPAAAAALAACLAAVSGAFTAGCASDARILPVTAAGLDSLRRASDARVVFLNVWATWCEPCREEMPAIVRLRSEYGRGDLEILLLSADDPGDLEPAVIPFLRSAGVDFPSYIIGDRDQDAVIRSLDPDWSGALPATFITARGGETPRVLVGERTYDQFRSEIDALLAD